MVDSISTALSGLLANQTKASGAASNIANVSTTGSLDENSDKQAPYTPVDVTFTSQENGGVTAQVTDRQPSFVPSYAPDSPFADAEGIIGSPNIRLEEEIVTLKQAELSYKANAKVVKVALELQDELLDAIDTKE